MFSIPGDYLTGALTRRAFPHEMNRAMALYEAKRSGRNRIAVARQDASHAA